MSQIRRECGPRTRPESVDAISGMLAVAIAGEVGRRGLRPRQLSTMLGVTMRRAYEIHAWLHGRGDRDVGIEAALRIAERLGIETEVKVRVAA